MFPFSVVLVSLGHAAVLSLVVSNNVKSCPTQSLAWVDLGGDFCYIIEETDRVDWNEALYRCFRAGGSLSSFHSAEELYRVHLQIYGDPFFIGLRQYGYGTFEWADKSAMDFTNWARGEPNNKVEMCGVMNTHSGEWNDVSCETSHRYICSAAKAGQTPNVQELQKICPKSSTIWRDFGGKYCYIIQKTHGVTWYDASGLCTAQGGSLASFHSAEEVSIIVQKIKDVGTPLHIGFKQKIDGSFEWEDQTVVNFMNWNFDEPNSLTEKCSVIYPNSGKWNDISCSKTSGYICSTPKVNPSTTPDGLKLSCPESLYEWKDFGGDSCYIIETEISVDWSNAKQRCWNAGGSLASFHSLHEINRILPHLTPGGPRLHIGLLHLNQDRDTLEWDDSSDVDFLNWNPGEPNNRDEICVEMYQDNGKWNDVHCYARQGYICSTRKVPSCSGDVCKNGGICNKAYQKCRCPLYYKGVTCEEVIICENDTCENGGICTQDGPNGVFRCTCKHGYQGQLCQERILCAGDTCKNRGICTQDDPDGVFWCSCQQGYEGSICQETILCKNGTCKNDGLCTQDGPNGVFRCSCHHGYQGTICEERILCGNDTCENEGLCTQDGPNNVFSCSCQHGYRGSMCEETILCKNDTCENDGLCIQDGPNGVFRCSCNHGYQGPRCEERILCRNDTCENEGLCTQDGPNNVFRCSCQNGYQGQICEEIILCKNDTCENDGLCTQDGPNGVFRCSCNHGYQGPRCEEKILCGNDTCANEGLCTQDGPNKVLRCSCQHGYQGPICEETILCKNDTCKNDGLCIQDGPNGIFRCSCHHGYQGRICEEKIFCGNDTCKNKGLCTQDGPNSVFRCLCQHGYQGEMCEEKILCENDTCENEGVCTQDGPNYVFRCSCQHGYLGRKCEEKTLCHNGPCKNKGICTQDGPNSVFRCSCQHGYKGRICEERSSALIIFYVGICGAVIGTIGLAIIILAIAKLKRSKTEKEENFELKQTFELM